MIALILILVMVVVLLVGLFLTRGGPGRRKPPSSPDHSAGEHRSSH